MYQDSMYESAPTEREGQRIDELVPEAIDLTANATTDGGRTAPRSGAGQTDTKVRNLKALAAAEAVLIAILLILWVL